MFANTDETATFFEAKPKSTAKMKGYKTISICGQEVTIEDSQLAPLLREMEQSPLYFCF